MIESANGFVPKASGLAIMVGAACQNSQGTNHTVPPGRVVFLRAFQAVPAWLPSFNPYGMKFPRYISHAPTTSHFSPITNHLSPPQISQVNAVSARSIDISRGRVAWRTACMPPITLLRCANPSASRILAAIELR